MAPFAGVDYTAHVNLIYKAVCRETNIEFTNQLYTDTKMHGFCLYNI